MDVKREQFEKGVEEFNSGAFFECHDTLEELWMETGGKDRLFLQGLIQVSVGLYHFSNGNFKGASSQLAKGLTKLEQYIPVHCGVELLHFTGRVHWWLEHARECLSGTVPVTDGSGIPKITFIQEYPNTKGSNVCPQ